MREFPTELAKKAPKDLPKKFPNKLPKEFIFIFFHRFLGHDEIRILYSHIQKLKLIGEKLLGYSGKNQK